MLSCGVWLGNLYEDDISEMPGALPSVDWHGQFHGLRETLRSLGDVKLEHTLPLRPTNKSSGKSFSNPDIPRWADTADSYDPWFVEESKTKSRKSSRKFVVWHNIDHGLVE